MEKYCTGLLVALGIWASPAQAETTACTEIATLPAVITIQGIYCLKHDLVTAITTGNAIEIQTNNVVIDMNGWKLGGLSAGAGTQATGMRATNRKNITIHNGSIRGFYRGVYLQGASGSGHLVEGIRADGNRFVPIQVEGDNIIVRDNHVINTGSSSVVNEAYGITIQSANNVSVTGNIIAGMSEVTTVRGIYLVSSTIVEVNGNRVFDLDTATSRYGISFFGGSNLTIIDNQINNSGGGTTAIFERAPALAVDCINNVVRGYTTGSSGCDYSSGNHEN